MNPLARFSDLELLKELTIRATLARTLEPRENDWWSDVFRVVTDEWNLSIDTLTGPLRRKEIVEARTAAMWLLDKLTSETRASIGYLFNRDHSTVTVATKRAASWIETDPVFAKRINRLSVLLRLPRTTPASQPQTD